MREIFIDYFAGGGGASQGIKLATGRSPDIAVNHDPDALAMYAANHRGRGVKIVLDDVFSVNLRKLVRGRPVGGFWASPDCRDFSRAKGGQPVSRRVRGLAWSVIKVAKQVRPRVIFLENVCEFEEWGPLIPRLACRGCDWKGTEGQACLVRRVGKTMPRCCPRCSSRKLRDTGEFVRDPERLGLTFKIWLGKLRALGYHIEYRKINACDHGAGTKRKRLCLIARCDGEPIVWPEPTHGPPEKCGQRSLFGPKLKPYRTAAEFLQWDIPCPSIFDRKKPLKPKSQWRVAKGLERYVLNNPRPFIVGVGGRSGQSPPTSVDSPTGTFTAKNDRAVVAPQIVPMTHNGERRCHPVTEPSPVITGAKRGELALWAATLIQLAHGEGKNGRWGDSTADVEKPLGVIHAGGNNHAAVAMALLKFRGDSSSGGQWQSPADPLHTATAKARFAVVQVTTGEWCFTPDGIERPKQVARWAIEQLGLEAVEKHLLWVHDPETGETFPLLTAKADGVRYLIADIGLRMLKPRELARCQGFDDSYKLSGNITKDVARIGNSVSPPMARALVAANFSFRNIRRRKPAGVK